MGNHRDAAAVAALPAHTIVDLKALAGRVEHDCDGIIRQAMLAATAAL